jgi:hypothetical protein
MYVKDDLGYKKKVRHRSKRPFILTLICMVFVGYGFYDIVNSFFTPIKLNCDNSLCLFYPAFNSLMVVFGFVSISGIWSMEKWGPISLSIILPLNLITELIFFEWGKGHFGVAKFLEFSIWVLACIVGFIFLSKMRRTN